MEARTVQWWECSVCGGIGGALFEVLAVFGWLSEWQAARRTATGRVRGRPPRLLNFVDVPAHAWMLAFRTVLGAGTAALFGGGGQVNGPYIAVAIGFAAPSILAQLGTIPQVAAAVKGESSPKGTVPATTGTLTQAVKSDRATPVGGSNDE